MAASHERYHVYEGERNAAGEREGYGTVRFADGGVYEGQWKGGKREGRGTYRFADGNVYEGEYKAGNREGRGTFRFADGSADVWVWKAGAPVGEGLRWSADGSTAWRLRDGGTKVEVISLEEARRVAAEHGLPLPEGV